MCIRDSINATKLFDDIINQFIDLGFFADVHYESAHAAFGPVSYTHLRAHETVLDLVCRLLLEKKK